MIRIPISFPNAPGLASRPLTSSSPNAWTHPGLCVYRISATTDYLKPTGLTPPKKLGQNPENGSMFQSYNLLFRVVLLLLLLLLLYSFNDF